MCVYTRLFVWQWRTAYIESLLQVLILRSTFIIRLPNLTEKLAQSYTCTARSSKHTDTHKAIISACEPGQRHHFSQLIFVEQTVVATRFKNYTVQGGAILYTPNVLALYRTCLHCNYMASPPMETKSIWMHSILVSTWHKNDSIKQGKTIGLFILLLSNDNSYLWKSLSPHMVVT